jgi:predicted site-specific integrase-resolvase
MNTPVTTTASPVGWLGSLKEMATYCGQSPRTVQRWIAAGHLKVRRLSKKSLVCKPADLDAAIRAVANRFEAN